MRASKASGWLVAGVLSWLVSGCQPPDRPSGADASAAGADIVVAEVSGRAITQAELDAWLRDAMWQAQIADKSPAELYELRADGLEQMIEEQLVEIESEREGTTRKELLARNVEPAPVDDIALRYFYDQNQARLGGASFEEIAPQVRSYLEEANRAEAARAYVAALRERAQISIELEPPRVEVAVTGPSRGPQDAPVTIVEFSDYQCPFCKRAEPTVKQVLARYGDQVRLVYRHYPLDFHDRAGPAAEAAACADAQGRFWEYHERLYSDAGALADEDLERVAGESGLDLALFKTCTAEHRYRGAVETDLREGSAAGVDGTPAFFINGLPLTGAQPHEKLVRLIDGELARIRSAAESGS